MSAGNMEDIAELFRTMRFRKKLFGGVDERDVWRQLEQLQAEYRSVSERQEERYLVLLQERENMIRSLKKQIAGMRTDG